MKLIIRKQVKANEKRQTWWQKAYHPYAYKVIDKLELPLEIEDEYTFVKWMLKNYGVGYFSVISYSKGKKGFRTFWTGYIETEKYMRIKGQLSLFMKPEESNVWNRIS